MSILTQIIEDRYDEEFLKADGFDDAVIGVCYNSSRLIYSYKKCLDILIAEGMDKEDAMEHLSFNVMGAYVGEKTPIWCMDNYE
tara:strand:+ start:116 stop:367 length:252 start_codon:yes stop_codon:yes gene_type:complete